MGGNHRVAQFFGQPVTGIGAALHLGSAAAAGDDHPVAGILPAIGFHQKFAICLPDMTYLLVGLDLHLPVGGLHFQHPGHAGSLIAVRIHPAIPVPGINTQQRKETDGVRNGKLLNDLPGKTGIRTPVAGGLLLYIGEIAPAVAGGENFFRRLAVLLQHGHRRALAGGPDGRRQPGGAASDNYHTIHRGSSLLLLYSLFCPGSGRVTSPFS